MALKLLHNNILQEIEKFCKNCEIEYNLPDLLSLYNGSAFREKPEDAFTAVKVEAKYGYKTIILNDIIFLEDSDGIFCKIINDDAIPLTHEDEDLCTKFNRKTIEGLF